MSVTPSPLRYPGGKTQLTKFVENLITENELEGGVYVEPFAGGCGIAWKLLFSNQVEKVVINDLSLSIFCFWDAVLNRTDELCELITDTPITIEQWYSQKQIQKQQIAGLELGFSTFFLNRVNRSGIINAGVIGGKAQAGNYKLDCRFNKKKLIGKIRKISEHSSRVTLTNLDASDFLKTKVNDLGDKVLINIDPPYYNKGKALYQNFFKHDDHVQLSKVITDLRQPWILTYDNTPEIFQLYQQHYPHPFSINYSAQVKRRGSELMVFSPELSSKGCIRQLIA